MWVLIVIMVTSTGSVTSINAEFGSESACKNALKGAERSALFSTYGGNIEGGCYPKG